LLSNLYLNEVDRMLGRAKEVTRLHPQSTGCMVCALHAEAQETNGTATETQGRVPPASIPTRGSGDLSDQPGAAWLGELLRGRKLWRVLQLHPRLGGKEGPAPYDESSETQRLRLDAVE